jgi:hypothetical protein
VSDEAKLKHTLEALRLAASGVIRDTNCDLDTARTMMALAQKAAAASRLCK